jgi:AraC family transcriptional regulator of adaptative response/methylated-DNA-[protein]-cysteine methyltransferase
MNGIAIGLADGAVDGDARWRAVLDRDLGADGCFVYAVRSTGIYCRPSCPSRRPRRTVVRFYTDVEQARADGFRACRRCDPDRDPGGDLARVRVACRFIEANLEGGASLGAVVAAVGGTPRGSQRSFKRLLGASPAEYRAACRVSRFKALVRGEAGFAEAIYEAGYGSSSRLYEAAEESLGMTPGAYAGVGPVWRSASRAAMGCCYPRRIACSARCTSGAIAALCSRSWRESSRRRDEWR